MSHCIMHLPGDIMSQFMHPPRRHFVPLSQFESPYLGQSLRVAQAYLRYILGNFWPYLRHIHKKTIVQMAFLGDKLSHPTKCPTLSPATKCPNLYALMHRKVMESCWDILSIVPLCQFVECAFREHLLNIFWLHSDYILSFLSFFYILVANSNVIMSPNRKIPP